VHERPQSVTVVCWIMIVLSVVALVGNTLAFNDPTVVRALEELNSRSSIPITMQYVRSYADLLVMLITGIAMLWGQNWARLLIVIWSAIGLASGLATAPLELILIPWVVSFVVLIAVTFVMFRPRANEYFRARRTGRASVAPDPLTQGGGQ
jgi:hypothetical protein